MPFYNLICHNYKIILSVQPKCGSSTIKSWISEQESFKKNNFRTKTQVDHKDNIADHMIPNSELSSESYKAYKKILIVRNLYDRLISYFCLFVIDTRYGTMWIHADKNKTISLENKSFKEFIYILKNMDTEEYQHHLIPQTDIVDIKTFDKIINISKLNWFFIQKGMPEIRVHNEQKRTDYRKCVINMVPQEFTRNMFPSYKNFYDETLAKIINNHIYSNDYKILKDYFTTS